MSHDTRRRFLLGAAGTSLAFVSCAKSTAGDRAAPEGEQAEDVAPPEDLMREHGVLNRILLVYDESARRLETHQPLPISMKRRMMSALFARYRAANNAMPSALVGSMPHEVAQVP